MLSRRWRSDIRRLVAGRTAELRRAETASAQLRQRAALLRERLAQAAQLNAATQHRIAALEQDAAAARLHLTSAEARLGAARERQLAPQLARAVDRVERREAAADDARAGVADRLDKAEAGLAAAAARAGQLESALGNIRGQVEKAARARDRARSERQAALSRLHQFETGVAAVGTGAWTKVAHVLSAAGVNVNRFFARFGLSPHPDEGGPFVAARPDQLRPTAARQEALGKMLKSLPLTLPLRHYRMTSPFGMRSDPFNHRPAFHPGIDLAAPYMTPVYATAAGTVSYAGWKTGYGKIVEVDLGNGIVTRYAHLHRYTVAVGEKVREGTQVGYLGSTGRSTGPHVLYEVDVHGKPEDPERFIELGHDIRMVVANR